MKWTSTLTSKYLKVADLNGERKRMTVKGVEQENVAREDEDPKSVVYFHGEKKGLVLNRTNGNALMQLYGDEMNGWVGKDVVLVPSETDYQGKRVPCIRLAKPKTPAPPPTTPPADDGGDDPGF